MVSGLKGKGVKDLVQYLMEQVFSSIPVVHLPYLSESCRVELHELYTKFVCLDNTPLLLL
jgi:hypothetical protein